MIINKRKFISNSISLLLGASSVLVRSSDAAVSRQENNQVILTITGAIDHTNRAKFDGVMDQLMHKHGIHFERAYQFTLADLEKLPAVSIRPTMEYDAQVHQLSGPRLIDVLNVAGLNKSSAKKILLHGIDGYSPEISLDLAQQYNFILATHIDGKLLHVGGFGPLFALYDADRVPEAAQKPLSQRFTQCPWGLYCIEVV